MHFEAVIQRVVDQGLVITAPSVLNGAAKVLQDAVVEANRDFGLSRFLWDYRTTFGMRKINITIRFSGGLFHSVPFAVGWLSKLKCYG